MQPSAHILLVDDEAPIRLTLGALLRRAGYQVTTAASGEDAVALLDHHRFDLLLVDLKMPGIDGMAVVRAAQERDPDAVIIILTGHGTLESAIEGLRRDIFDYLLKTSDPQQVLTRVAEGLRQRAQTLHRKQMLQTLAAAAAELSGVPTPGAAPEHTPTARAQEAALEIGPLRIDPVRQEATLDGRSATLTPTELRVLVCLAQQAGRALSYAQLVACAQGYETFAAEAAELIKPHIHHLRQKLEADPARPRYILTVRGTGYMLAIAPDA
ncbi:response regulator transcription factor [Kallotenue papyrolyticum]|uniref:response regulator transcription factor n=1 Tax=Kallotenue papyrolyticum TaxID=1325125 RepID=UPI0004728864|nr:response regulator transcription factor [Kallotenue papyrolyticum]